MPSLHCSKATASSLISPSLGINQASLANSTNDEVSCLNSKYRGFEGRFMEPFARWADDHVSHLRLVNTIFYPFSGPDILYPYLLNPRAKHYVLCGLEACDLLGETGTWSHAEGSDWNSAMQEAVSHYFACGYYVTTDLHEGLRQSDCPSVVPILIFLLEKLGLKIHAVVPMRLAVKMPRSVGLTMPSEEDGVHIEFEGLLGIQHLYFFKRDLRDDFDLYNRPMYEFLNSLGNFKVFSKSASYLLHETNFSKVHDFILEKSAAILQDPSHIPFERFIERDWKVTLFGNYAQAPKVFPQYEQHSLQMTRIGQEVDFGFGYWMDSKKSSLMLAEPESRFNN